MMLSFGLYSSLELISPFSSFLLWTVHLRKLATDLLPTGERGEECEIAVKFCLEHVIVGREAAFS